MVGWEDLENPQPKPQPLDETRSCREGETSEERRKRKKKEWAARNREKRNAQKKAERLNRIEHYREINRRGNLKYRAKISMARRLIQAGSRSLVNANQADIVERTDARNRANRSKWRAANAAENKRQRDAYRKANPELFRALSLARVERMKDDSCKPNKRMIEQIHRTAARITRCTGIKHHVDHIVPLARGGPHHESNLQVLPAAINLRKGARMVA